MLATEPDAALLAAEPDETIEVWKTSCPRLSVWEDALADQLVRVDRRRVLLTDAGRNILAS